MNGPISIGLPSGSELAAGSVKLGRRSRLPARQWSMSVAAREKLFD